MQKGNDDEKKVNLIKCPLPKIIYTAMSSLSTFQKKSGNTTSNNTYYLKKSNNQNRDLPSLITNNNKYPTSPNKTNYLNIKLNNNLNNNKTKNTTIKISNIDNKATRKQGLKEVLNNYGLNKYYDRLVELGLNDQNINNLGLMTKRTLNEFISNVKMFPGHIVKMEQLHEHLKQSNISNNNQLHNNTNSKLKTPGNENNNVNYVTISFNRSIHNHNINDKIMHSHSYYKQKLINHSIKSKIKTINVNNNSEASKTKILQSNNISNNKNIKNKSKSKNRMSITNKSNFELPIPVNERNILIKHFFKDLENYSNNMNEIANTLTDANNKTNKHLYNNYSKKESTSTENYENNSLTASSKDLYQEKKVNTLSNTYNERQLAKNILLKNHPSNLNDLPSINNKKMLKDHNTGYPNLNTSPQLEVKNENIKNEREKKNKKIKNKNTKSISNDKFDKSRTIENYKRVLSINTIMNDDLSKNVNNNNNLTIKIPSINIKDNLKSNIRQKTSYETSNKANSGTIIGNGMKLRLPNVLNKTDVYIKKDSNKTAKNANTNININSNIVLKTEKTVLKKKNKNALPISIEKLMVSQNEQKQLEKENNIVGNTFVINNWDENAVVEEQKPIRLREKAKINDLNVIQNKEENGNNNKNKADNNIISDINKKEISNINQNEDKIEKDKNIITNNEKNNIENNVNTHISEKIDIKENKADKEKTDKNSTSYNIEDIIYENLRLNRSFSENKKQNIYSFDLEFICRCVSMSLLILIESSRESPHITDINLEALSATNIRYFFLSDKYNENINILLDLFDKEVNTNINGTQISPLDRLNTLYLEKDEDINFDVNCLKHIKKETDEILIKEEEEREKAMDKNGKDTIKLRTGLGDIEKDIRFIDEFFSMNSRSKKRVINYQHVSEISKNVLCKELSYINEIDSELNGTNSNINNTNNFNNSNNNINENSIRAKKNNLSNLIDNEELKEIKEIKENNNNEEDNNNTFNNEMNELGIINENDNNDNNDDYSNRNELKKNASNNSINLGGDEIQNVNEINSINKKEFDLGLNEDDNIASPINNPHETKSDNDNDKDNDDENIANDMNGLDNENKLSDKNKEKENDIKITENNGNKDIQNLVEKNDADADGNDKNGENKEKGNQNKEVEKEKEPKVINNEELKSNQNKEDSKEKEKENEEDDKFELDYVIDINSIDELIYYFIKRAEIFDEDFNYLIMKTTERRYIPPPDPQTIFDFMADIIILTKMEKEVIVLSLIYIERYIFNTGLLLTSRNWRRILLTSMIISSKLWDDNSFENGHFSQVFANLGVSEINTLERIFLELINYNVYLKQSEYFKYLLMVKSIALQYNYNGQEIVPVSVIKSMKYQEFTEVLQNRMRKKVTLNNSAQF